MRKFCSICQVERDIRDFNRRGVNVAGLPRYRSECRIHQIEYKKQWNKNNQDKISQYDRDRYKNNTEYEKNRTREYRKNNLEKSNQTKQASIKRRLVRDPIFKLRYLLSHQVNKALKKICASKNNTSCLTFFPFTINELKQHLEAQFEPWMAWKNHGAYNKKKWNDNDSSTWTWNLDHIVPQSDLSYTSMEHPNFQKCWSLNNLRPLSSKQNILDGISRVRHKDNK